ncbi:hypothetical protein QZH41_005341 [Actinostola sp. cb2023]|nr:hypothetical protein QZH41_005341 [Actinostola sp. cb2023]
MSTMKIPSFREDVEDWESFYERLQSYFRLHKTKEDVQVDTLIANLGPAQYQTLKSLVFPAKPIEKEFKDLIEVMRNHYEGKKNPRTERCKFRAICQGESESIQTYAVRLREASRRCKFGANLDENLIDQFLIGVNSSECVKKILKNTEELNLSFQSAVDIALEVHVTYPEPPNVGEEVLLLEHLALTTVCAEDIRRWTDRDPVLARGRKPTLEQQRLEIVQSLGEDGAAKIVNLQRWNIVSELMNLYENDKEIVENIMTFQLEGEMGSDFRGVSREVYSSFWKEGCDQFCEGIEIIFVPRHSGLSKEEYITLGKIMGHGYVLTGFFPVMLSQSYMQSVLIGEETVSDDFVMTDFINYLSPYEANTLQHILTSPKLQVDDIDFVIDLEDRYGMRIPPNPSNIRNIVQHMARSELLEMPMFTMKYLKQGMMSSSYGEQLWKDVSANNLNEVYQAQSPNPSTVLSLLTSEDETTLSAEEAKIYTFLKRYVRNLDQTKCAHFLKYCTGSTTVVVRKISQTQQSLYQKRIPVGQCWRCLPRELFNEECENIKTIFRKLRYPAELIDKTISDFTKTSNDQHRNASIDTEKSIRIVLPFIDQKPADIIDGVAMGSPLAPVLANLFMGHHEKHKNIRFTMEKESEHKLAFLDVLIENKDYSVVTKVFRKFSQITQKRIRILLKRYCDNIDIKEKWDQLEVKYQESELPDFIDNVSVIVERHNDLLGKAVARTEHFTVINGTPDYNLQNYGMDRQTRYPQEKYSLTYNAATSFGTVLRLVVPNQTYNDGASSGTVGSFAGPQAQAYNAAASFGTVLRLLVPNQTYNDGASSGTTYNAGASSGTVLRLVVHNHRPITLEPPLERCFVWWSTTTDLQRWSLLWNGASFGGPQPQTYNAGASFGTVLRLVVSNQTYNAGASSGTVGSFGGRQPQAYNRDFKHRGRGPLFSEKTTIGFVRHLASSPFTTMVTMVIRY